MPNGIWGALCFASGVLQTQYFYLPYALEPGQVGIVEGRLANGCRYASLSLLDMDLQPLKGQRGPTHLNHETLGRGPFSVQVGSMDHGGPFLDVGNTRKGVLALRQIGGGPITAPSFVINRAAAGSPGLAYAARGPMTWGPVRFVWAWVLGLLSVVRWDFVHTLALMQDVADLRVYERLAQRILTHPQERALLLGNQVVEPGDFDLETLAALPASTFGHQLWGHMSGHGFLEELAPIAPSPLPEAPATAWAKARWRSTHDFRHVLTGLGPTVGDETLLHAFQLGQHWSWVSFAVVCVGPWLSLLDGGRPLKVVQAIPGAIGAGRRSNLLAGIELERYLTAPLSQLRDHLGIVPVGDRYLAPPRPIVNKFLAFGLYSDQIEQGRRSDMAKTLRAADHIVPLGEFKSKAASILDTLRVEGHPLVITQNGRPACVVLAPDEYDRLVDHDRFTSAVLEGFEDLRLGRAVTDQDLGTMLDQAFGPPE